MFLRKLTDFEIFSRMFEKISKNTKIVIFFLHGQKLAHLLAKTQNECKQMSFLHPKVTKFTQKTTFKAIERGFGHFKATCLSKFLVFKSV